MVRIAPVRLSFNPKTFWFDAGTLELEVDDNVVVTTARGTEFGTIAKPIFDLEEEKLTELKSPLKPVKRLATEEDVAQDAKNAELSALALPIFKQLAKESIPDMNPIAVEYLFDGDKAVFYFEAEERVDFRDLVRKLATEFHVRVDMKQIGVRDEARMIGGLGHCGQELCCRRFGGGFDPVSIRMAKEQELSLNPQKISGVCGRLMCCLRYEYEAYKDFHGRAPKKNAKIQTPDGEGKVVDMDVPREIITIKVGDDKPVKVPLADFDEPEKGERPSEVGQDAWERANEPAIMRMESAFNLFTNQLGGEDKLAEPGKVRHVHGEDSEKKPERKPRRRNGKGAAKEDAAAAEKASTQRKPRRRRSTTVSSDGETQVVEKTATEQADKQARMPRQRGARKEAQAKRTQQPRNDRQERKTVSENAEKQETSGRQGQEGEQKKPSRRRRSRSRNSSGQGAQQATQQGAASSVQTTSTRQTDQLSQERPSKVGRNSSGLRANRNEQDRNSIQNDATTTGSQPGEQGAASSSGRRRRRRSRSNANAE